jgi:tRNA 2-thiouridine synthesizing protein C
MTAESRILLLLRQAPYASARSLEAVDVAMVAAAFELPVTVLFADDGVWQLLAGQDGSVLHTRTQSKVLSVLPHYDVTELYVCAESLARAGLGMEELVLPVKPLTRPEIRTLIAAHTAVVND